MLNMEYRTYHHHVVISIDANLTILEHTQLWSKISRKLKSNGVVAFCVREINRRDRVYYHLISASYVPLGKYKTVEATDIRVHVEPIKDRYGLSYYVLKASDEHEHKRRYFAKDNTLSKIGTIGDFWGKPHKTLWSTVIDNERKLASYRESVEWEAQSLHDLVDPALPFAKIVRILCSQAVRRAERKERAERGIL